MTLMTAERRLEIEAASARELLAAVREDIDGDEALLVTTIEGETSLLEAFDAALRRMIELKNMQVGLQGVIDTVKRRKERFESQEDRLKALMLRIIKEIGLPTTQRPLATIGTAKVPDKLNVSDESALPEQAWRQPEPEVDTAKLTAMLKDQAKRFETAYAEALTITGGNEREAREITIDRLRKSPEGWIEGATLEAQPNRINIRFA